MAEIKKKKKSACNAGHTGDMGLILNLGRPPGGGRGNPLQDSCLGSLMDRGAWRAAVHGATKIQTRLRMAHSPLQRIDCLQTSPKNIKSAVRRDKLWAWISGKRQGTEHWVCAVWMGSPEGSQDWGHILAAVSGLWPQVPGYSVCQPACLRLVLGD